MRIGVVARLDVEEAIQLAGKIIELLMERNVETVIDTSVMEKLNKYEELACPLEDMDTDIIIAVGGDGTILRTQSLLVLKKSQYLV